MLDTEYYFTIEAAKLTSAHNTHIYLVLFSIH